MKFDDIAWVSSLALVTISTMSDPADCDEDGDIGSITSLQLLQDEVSEQTNPLQWKTNHI